MSKNIKLQCKDCNDNLTDCTCIEYTVDMKQETLEEVVNNFKKTDVYINEIKQEQDKKMYSEEEVENIIQKLMHDVHCGDLCYGEYVIDFKLSPRQWFEQFKNK
jgi:Glu-tRNA(Gln) amidotransferase subunit E-like FAD-binding protein